MGEVATVPTRTHRRLTLALVALCLLLGGVLLCWFMMNGEGLTARPPALLAPATAPQSSGISGPLRITQVRVIESAGGGGFALFLADESQQRAIDMIIGETEARKLSPWLSKPPPREPTSIYGAVLQALKAADANLERMEIDQLASGSFTCILRIRAGDRMQDVDCRPSDGINFSVRSGAAVIVSEAVAEQAAVRSPDGQVLTPSEALELLQKMRIVAGPATPPGATGPARAQPLQLTPPSEPLKLPLSKSGEQEAMEAQLKASLLPVETVTPGLSDSPGQAAIVFHLPPAGEARAPLSPPQLTPAWMALSASAVPRPQTAMTARNLLWAARIRVSAVALRKRAAGDCEGVIMLDMPESNPPAQRLFLTLDGFDVLCLALCSRAPIFLDKPLAEAWRP